MAPPFLDVARYVPLLLSGGTLSEDAVRLYFASGRAPTMPDDPTTITDDPRSLGGQILDTLIDFGKRLGILEDTVRLHDHYGPRLDSVERDIAAIRGDVAHINTHLTQQDQDAQEAQDAAKGRIDEVKNLLQGEMDTKLSKVLEIQEHDHKATERRLLIAEGALASYVAGEQHRRDRTRTMERAVFGVGTTILTGLILLLFSQFFGRPHNAGTLVNDAIAVAGIIIFVLADMFMGWRIAVLSGPQATSPHAPAETPPRLP